jgi:A/G-specific adenine glycosylase
VKDVYERFTAAFPTPADLAAASPASLQEILRPLGLAKRVSTLKRMGERLVSAWRGAVPLEVAELMKLPGVGRYTAAATVCFAADARSAVVDANVIRVFARFFGVTSQKARPRDDVLMWRLAESLLPHSRATEYNRALIDFAALVCRPRIPLCSVCPLSRECCLGRQACGVT